MVRTRVIHSRWLHAIHADGEADERMLHLARHQYTQLTGSMTLIVAADAAVVVAAAAGAADSSAVMFVVFKLYH